MRILYLTERFIPFIGGIETMSMNLLGSLTEQGHEIIVVTSHTGASLADIDMWANIPVHRLHMLDALTNRNLSQIVETRAKLKQLKRDFKPDVVHIQFSGPSSLFHWDTQVAYPAPTIVTLHSVPPQISQSKSLLVKTMQQSTWVVGVSNYMLSWMQKLVPEITPRSSVIYNGIEAPTQPIGALPFDPPNLIWIGRMVHWKRVDIMIHAFHILHTTMPNVTLKLVGDGPERPQLEKLVADLRLDDVVDFSGWVSGDQIPNMLNQATIVVITSEAMENLPMVAIESARYARPILASNVSGLPEVIDHGSTGVLIDDVTPQNIANSLYELLQDKDQLIAMGVRGSQLISTRFNIDTMVEKYTQVYEHCVKLFRK